jgi:hypothetical protein
MTRKANKISPIFPGEILNEDYLIPAGISVNRLAMDIHVPVSRVYEIVKGERAITADTAATGALPRHDCGVLDEFAGEVRAPEGDR